MRITYKYVCILLMLTPYSSTISSQSCNNSLPIFVSLGENCEPALSLKNLGLRTEAYPFDWNITTQFSGICNMIENNFKNLLNPLFLKHNGVNILNTLYTIEFRHDFPYLSPYGPTNVLDFDVKLEDYLGGPIVDNFLDFLPIVTEKYTRRINRFIELLNSPKKIIFIRTNLTPKDAEQFVALMTTYYPNLNYQLIGLQSDKNMATEFQQIPSVKVYYTETKRTDFVGWIYPQEWQTIMANIISNNK